MDRNYTIGRLAAEAGVNVETVRYYQRRKLMAEPKRPASGRTRRYSSADAQRLRFIKAAQRMGFSLVEVRDLLKLLDPISCSKARAMVAAKLEFVDERIRALKKVRKELNRMLAGCGSNVDERRCPIIEGLSR